VQLFCRDAWWTAWRSINGHNNYNDDDISNDTDSDDDNDIDNNYNNHNNNNNHHHHHTLPVRGLGVYGDHLVNSCGPGFPIFANQPPIHVCPKYPMQFQ
jgi:hypothetical protein